jgi:K+-transporting ATPase ATPase C chain
MNSQLRPAVTSFLMLTLITGGIYPLAVTAIAQLIAPSQANGSLVIRNGTIRGSLLIAQPFTESKYFWPRPSACNYDGSASAGSNQAASNPALIEARQLRSHALASANPGQSAPPPGDLLAASGSGLDPDITLEAAFFQIPRVAASRGMAPEAVRAIVDRHIQPRTLGILGEPRINVLTLNLALDGD